VDILAMGKLGIKTYLEKSDYFDFELTRDNGIIIPSLAYLNQTKAIELNVASKDGRFIESTAIWSGATVQNITMNNMHFVQFDNGFFTKPVDREPNYTINSGDKFKVHGVDGYKTDTPYIINETQDDIVGTYHKLDGGFYQGFFKLFKYPFEVLPKRMKRGWTMNCSLRFPINSNVENTLNDDFPANSGFFFYMGTRAENKYMLEQGVTKEQRESQRDSDVRVVDDLPDIDGYRIHYSLYRFVYNRGYRVFDDMELPLYYPEDREEPQELRDLKHENYPNDEGFKHYITHDDLRTDTAFYPLENLEEEKIIVTGNTDNIQNVIDNSLGFRIRPDGRIGYRLITTDQCLSSAKIGNIQSLLWTRYWGKSITNDFNYLIENDVLSGNIIDEPTGIQITELNSEQDYSKFQTKSFEYDGGNFYYVFFAWPKVFGRMPKMDKNPDVDTFDDFDEYEIENVKDNQGKYWDYWFYIAKKSLGRGKTHNIRPEYEGVDFSDYLVKETYSKNSIFNEKNDGWIDISVVFERNFELEPQCVLDYNQYREGRLIIYVNGRPVLKDEEFYEVIPHGLDAMKVAQEGVPFNISWGGGTQGLRETIELEESTDIDVPLLLENHFGGTWQGGIKDLNFYVKPFSFPEVRKLFKEKKEDFSFTGDFGGRYYNVPAEFTVS
jgi:hypothetical protein